MAICYNCFKEKEKSGKCPACGYDPAGAEEKFPMALHPGSILNGRYIVGRVLGQGGFGITYIAIDDHTGKRVAIKEYLPTEFAGRSGESTVNAYSRERRENFEFGKERFLEEAKTLAEFIGDEHIVRIYSYFEENNTAYFTMEYVEGLPLDKYMATRGGRLSTEEANELLLPLMDALDLVHSKGIVHRDIAPDNIIITPEGKAKLIDFGAARYSTGEKSKSLDVVIKHGFAPKEQYTRHGRQGPFTDVYAMGATYYYAITGRVPPDSIDRIEEDDLVLPSALGVKIRAREEEALEKALEVSSSERYRSMGEFRAAMAAAGENNQQEQEKAEEEAQREKEEAERARAEKEKKEREAAEKQRQEKEKKEAAECALKEREEAEASTEDKTSAETSEKKKRPSWLIPALASAAAFIVLIAVFAGKGGKTGSGKETAVTGEKTTEAKQSTEANKTGNKKQTEESGNESSASETDYWTLKDGVLTISCVGDMPNYYYEGSPWNASKLNIQSVIIEDSVTSIGSRAFEGCSNLMSATIPNSVTRIEMFAFSECSSLLNVTIPSSVKDIGWYAFHKCISFTTVTIPEGVVNVGDSAFEGCSGMTNITIPSSVKSIGSGVFSECNSLTDIVIPEGVKQLDNFLFNKCSNLTNVIIPASVNSIGSWAFAFCSSLTNVEIPSGVSSIGEDAFCWCSGLTSVAIPSNVTIIREGTFSSCGSLASVTIPASVKRIDSDAFNGCWALKTVFYTGTKAEWNSIEIGDYNGPLIGNDYITGAEIEYK